MDQAPQSPVNPDFPTKLPENLPASKRGPTIFIIIVFFAAIITTSAVAGYWFVLKDKKGIACTTEAKICPDGSAVGRTGPKCEFAPCPTIPITQKPIPIATTGAEFLAIPELGIQLTLPPGLSDLRYHIEQYDTSTAALFTTDSLATKFPKCEFPMGGLGWITQASQYTQFQPKKIGNFYYGLETPQEACSRVAGSEEANQLEKNQKALFLQTFDTIRAL